MNNIYWAKNELKKLNPADKYETMTKSAAIITKLLESFDIVPIVVGGLSVEIYTNKDYSTRDIDFVTSNIKKSQEILQELGFQKEGRILSHNKLQILIEFPDDQLAGSYDKVSRILIDKNLYINVISYEDIIMDRLRAKLHWTDIESKRWGMYILAEFFDELDIEYMSTVGKGAETPSEVEELKIWLKELESGKSHA